MLYERFHCHSKEELYEKLLRQDIEVIPLIEFFQYAAQKNLIEEVTIPSLNSPEKVLNYIKANHIETDTVIFLDSKNRAISCCQEQNEEELLLQGYKFNAANSFVVAKGEDRIPHLKSILEVGGFPVIDTFTIINNSLYSSKIGGLVRDVNNEPLQSYSLQSDQKEYELAREKEMNEFIQYATMKQLIGCPYDSKRVGTLLKIGFQNETKEFLGLLRTDNNNIIQDVHILSMGGKNYTIFDKRVIGEYIANNKQNGLAGITTFHNHPSGGYEPSKEDFDVNQQLEKLLNLLHITYIDNLVCAKEGVYSIRKNNLLQLSEEPLFSHMAEKKETIKKMLRTAGYPINVRLLHDMIELKMEYPFESIEELKEQYKEVISAPLKDSSKFQAYNKVVRHFQELDNNLERG